MKGNLKAKFVGGPNDGNIWEVDQPYMELAVIHRVMERNGQWREVGTVKYRLKSKEPLEYAFVELASD